MSEEDRAGPREEDLLERMGSLPREAEVSSDLWPRIEARLASPSAPRKGEPRVDERRGLPRSRWWLRAAASIGIFAAGAASGILTMRGADSASVGSAEGLSGDEPLALAAEVQRTGSEYVAALAALTAADNSLPESARLQGRDVAWATLRGAVSHLAALGEGGEPGAERSFGVRSVTDEGRVRF